MTQLLLTNAIILTMDERRTILENGYLLTTGDAITAVGPMAALAAHSLPPDITTLDCSGKILLPGMVNTHCHAPMVVFRGLGDDVADRLRRYMIPLENRIMDGVLSSAGAAYAFAEMMLGGVTTVCDNYSYVDENATVAAQCGMRAMLGGLERIMPSTEPDPAADASNNAYTLRMIEKWKGHPLITPMVACHAPYSVTDGQMQESHRIARAHGLMMTMHVSEMVYEQAQCHRAYGMSSIAHLDALGILDDRFLAAHCILLEEGDLDILAQRGVKVSHNIGSNLKAAKGIAPVAQMRERGITVGLGTDGAMSGNTLDILTQLPLAAKLQKTVTGDRCVFPAAEVVAMATIGGAKALGMAQDIGSLEVGKKADMIVVETDSVNMAPIYDYYSALVYSANPSNVETTIIGGRIVMHQRKLRTMDFPAVRANLLQHCDRIRLEAIKLDEALAAQSPST